MANRIRNRECIPYISTEGEFEKPLVDSEFAKKGLPCGGSSVFFRLNRYHTLASARKFSHFKPFPDLIPQDSLDLMLTSTYNQTKDKFPEKVDVHVQPETLGIDTWRRLRNTRDLTPDREEQASTVKKSVDRANKRRGIRKKQIAPVLPYRLNYAHKVLIGGITEKRHPSNIKLINSSHHSPQTNGGYSRQPSDGNFYQY